MCVSECAYVCVSVTMCMICPAAKWSHAISISLYFDLILSTVCVFRCVSICACVFWSRISAPLSIVEVRKCCSVFFIPYANTHTPMDIHTLYTCVFGQLTVIHSKSRRGCHLLKWHFFVNIKHMIITVIIQVMFVKQMSLFCLCSLSLFGVT